MHNHNKCCAWTQTLTKELFFSPQGRKKLKLYDNSLADTGSTDTQKPEVAMPRWKVSQAWEFKAIRNVWYSNTPKHPMYPPRGGFLFRTDTQRGVLSGLSRERNLRSKIWWFTEFCNSHYVSHFAAFFIVTRTKISVVKSCSEFRISLSSLDNRKVYSSLGWWGSN